MAHQSCLLREMSEERKDSYPRYRNHFLPRTREGRVAAVLFVTLFLCTQPPILFVVANRVEPLIFGLPFLYVYLLVLYSLLIGVLIWTMRRGV